MLFIPEQVTPQRRRCKASKSSLLFSSSHSLGCCSFSFLYPYLYLLSSTSCRRCGLTFHLSISLSTHTHTHVKHTNVILCYRSLERACASLFPIAHAAEGVVL